VQDVLLTGAINAGSNNFLAYLYGGSVDLKVPGFTYFQLNVYVRDDQNQPGKTWQITPVWLYPFSLGSLKFSLQGFIDYAGAEGAAERNLLAAPRLWLDLGALWGAPGRVEAGVEYLYWQNKYGAKGVNESVIQPTLKWTF
jgi:nucleoside-specific outer membrane channel protein Tsx